MCPLYEGYYDSDIFGKCSRFGHLDGRHHRFCLDAITNSMVSNFAFVPYHFWKLFKSSIERENAAIKRSSIGKHGFFFVESLTGIYYLFIHCQAHILHAIPCPATITFMLRARKQMHSPKHNSSFSHSERENVPCPRASPELPQKFSARRVRTSIMK